VSYDERMPGFYQVVFLGPVDGRRADIQRAIAARLTDLGLDRDAIVFLDRSAADARNRSLPTLAIYFGAENAGGTTELMRDLISESVIIIPVVSSLARVRDEVPIELLPVNALELSSGGPGLDRLASLVLETFRLLRTERRLFISYKREDAQPFANCLYDALDAHGFDVFIDVRSVPPAVDFQSELWHRMSDADVVVLVDTPGFRVSRWTTAELARANLMNIQILHLLWPGQTEDATSAFSHFLELQTGDFDGAVSRGEMVQTGALVRICNEAERLRARAIAARQRYLIDNFCDAARDLGLSPAVQAEQWIVVQDGHGHELAVVPAVGVPTSDRLDAIFRSIGRRVKTGRDVWVIYDSRGVLSTWLAHLDWLDEHLPIRAVRMTNAPSLLKGLSS
jgi:hypothetical protein